MLFYWPLLFSLTACEELTKVFQIRCLTITFYDLFKEHTRAVRHLFQLKGVNYKDRHILRRRTPPPPDFYLPLIDFVFESNFFVDLGLFPSREQWYYGLIEVEAKFLKILHLQRIFPFLLESVEFIQIADTIDFCQIFRLSIEEFDSDVMQENNLLVILAQG